MTDLAGPDLIRQALQETRERGPASCVTTRAGRQAWVFHDSMPECLSPVWGAVAGADGVPRFAVWRADGISDPGGALTNCDLVRARRSGVVDVWVYANQRGDLAYRVDPPALGANWVLLGRTCAPWTEGEGLDEEES